jgi:hypothetical protein
LDLRDLLVVREYLKSRPQAQINRLLQRLKEGRIEATGMFLNYSEIIDEPALAAQTKTLRFLKDEGVDVTTAMQNDVNGSDEIPLVQFGDINTGRYYYRLKPKTNHIFSWVLNNYWVTNFKASQEGELRWSYSITSAADNSDTYATRFGWGERVPLKSCVLFPANDQEKSMLTDRSFINIDVPNLLLVNATPSLDNKGIVLHLRELEGDHAILDVRWLMEETGAIAMYEVNVLEEALKELSSPLLIEHFETKFVKLEFEQE